MSSSSDLGDGAGFNTSTLEVALRPIFELRGRGVRPSKEVVMKVIEDIRAHFSAVKKLIPIPMDQLSLNSGHLMYMLCMLDTVAMKNNEAQPAHQAILTLGGEIGSLHTILKQPTPPTSTLLSTLEREDSLSKPKIHARWATRNYSYGNMAMVKTVFNAALNDNEEPHVNGLVNIGATSFLNSILQSLAQSPLFLNRLIRIHDKQTIQLPGDPSKGVQGLQVGLDTWGPVTDHLAQVLANIPVSPSLKEPVKPDVLVQALHQNTEMNFSNEQEAQKFLTVLLDTLQDEYELKIFDKIEEVVQRKFTSSEEAIRVLKIYVQQAQRETVFRPTVLFNGFLTFTISCEKLHELIVSTKTFTTLNLPIPSSRKMRGERTAQPESLEQKTEDVCTLHSCLQQFVAPQCLKNFNSCSCMERLTGLRTHKMQTEITKAPRILVLRLGRFREDEGGNTKKVDVHVSFPSLLDISDFCDANCRASGNTIYSLYALVHHSGTPTGGHYAADVKVRHPRHLASGTLPEECQWYAIDDQSVTKTSESSVLERQAYLLFYEQLE